jgi:hypothetical protein
LIYVAQTLKYQTPDSRCERIAEDEFLGRDECLVVLGQQGMAKTCLLHRLAARNEFAPCTARQLLNRAYARTIIGDSRLVLIDALDEVVAQQDGAAVDLVLRRLGALGEPQSGDARVLAVEAAPEVAGERGQPPVPTRSPPDRVLLHRRHAAMVHQFPELRQMLHQRRGELLRRADAAERVRHHEGLQPSQRLEGDRGYLLLGLFLDVDPAAVGRRSGKPPLTAPVQSPVVRALPRD